jgi:hypothetical protein
MCIMVPIPRVPVSTPSMSPYPRGIGARRVGRSPRMVALCDLFEPLGDELIYALASFGGLFGYAAMKLRRNAQRKRPGVGLFGFDAAFSGPVPIIGDRIGECPAQFGQGFPLECKRSVRIDDAPVNHARASSISSVAK